MRLHAAYVGATTILPAPGRPQNAAMNSLKSIAKGGWHPEKKSSSSSSSSGDNDRFKNFKGLQQVASWTGHGPKPGAKEDPSTVTARPLTSLKDPYSFGAPPKRDPKAPLPPPTQPNVFASEDTPVPEQAESQEQEEESAPPRSFPANTTGLSTRGLPAPPKRTLGTTSTSTPATSPQPQANRPTPPLPNRAQPPPLPGRQTSRSLSSPEAPPPFPLVKGPGTAPSTAAASARLAQAGVSVPGLDIGTASTGTPSPPLPSRERPTPSPRAPPQNNAAAASSGNPYSMSELSGRFASLKPASSSSTKSTETPSAGTSWSQKQAAFKTVMQARKDPTSVSLSDAAAAAKTADNFRQRHGDQVVQGYQRAEAAGLVSSPAASGSAGMKPPGGGWGDVASRASKTASIYSNHSNPSDTSAADGGGSSALASIAAKKKPPPPPKPRDLDPVKTPPPIPLSTKPK
ncbi:hypothetical protein Dda_9195 [Drechslerella dactyloides]|uniref:GMP synthase n=1 Tax=Drechslerella dactyloides TaxID=74499 RepID=A0AAD6NGU8_DREDA|nr:hypothetical protein Dda_9195 [Drechslerella dactyloides]